MSTPISSTQVRARERRRVIAEGVSCGIRDCDAHRVAAKAEPRQPKPLPCRLGLHSHWRLVRPDEGRLPVSGAPPPGLPDYADGGATAICLACETKIHVSYTAARRAKRSGDGADTLLRRY